MNYGRAIRIARSIADISQGELADRSSLDRSYLSLIEAEKRKPTIETVEGMAEHAGFRFTCLRFSQRKNRIQIELATSRL